MKKTLLVLLVALLASMGCAMAQNQKIGYINSDDLMKVMPGRDSAQAVLQAEMEDLQKNLQTMQSELESRYKDYESRRAEMSDLIRQTKERELQDMNTRVKEFAENAQKQLQEREMTLLQPIIERAKKAITEVAEERGYSYILDDAHGVVLFHKDADDILPFVKAKLGIK